MLLEVFPSNSGIYQYINRMRTFDKTDFGALYIIIYQEVMRYTKRICIAALWRALVYAYCPLMSSNGSEKGEGHADSDDILP